MNPIGVLLLAGASGFFGFLFVEEDSTYSPWFISCLIFTAAILFWAAADTH